MLPDAFLKRPIAHRGLHDARAGVIENSLPAIEAAIDAGFGIEIDIQPSRDGVPMVFHDYDLRRLTGREGFTATFNAATLNQTPLLQANRATIPTLRQVLDTVAGRVPVLLEIKDQDGQLGPAIGALERAIATVLTRYDGPVAVMSFNPNSVRVMGGFAPLVPRGMVTGGFSKARFPLVPAMRRKKLARIADFNAAKASFVSHDLRDPMNPAMHALRAQGVPVLAWTVKDPTQESTARRFAQNITFEGYRPA